MSVKILTSEYLNQHRYFTARRDAYQLPSGKIVDPYFVVEMPTSVMVLAITKSGKALMVKQYRHPVGMELLELPGGFIDENETPEQAAQREMAEETGYQFDQYFYLGKTAGNPGVLNNVSHMLLAIGGEKVSGQSLDANEEIELVEISFDELKNKLLNGEILQSMHALTIFFALDFIQKNPDSVPQW